MGPANHVITYSVSGKALAQRRSSSRIESDGLRRRTGERTRQWTGLASLRSHVVDCQFEMTPLSPQDGHCHVTLSSAHRRYSITPEQAWRPGRRRHFIRRVAGSLGPPVAAATIAV